MSKTRVKTLVQETRQYDGITTDVYVRRYDTGRIIFEIDQGVDELVSLWMTQAEVEELVSWLQAALPEKEEA